MAGAGFNLGVLCEPASRFEVPKERFSRSQDVKPAVFRKDLFGSPDVPDARRLRFRSSSGP